ncbi:MAG: hypothetical protein ABJA67_02130 [Chthonomonadales bacterium]
MKRRVFGLDMICLLLVSMFGVSGCGKKSAPEANPTEVREFFTAVEDGDATIVARLVKVKPYLANAKDAEGKTALSIAKKKGNDEMVDALTKAGSK